MRRKCGWEGDVASLVIEETLRANGGVWPETKAEWEQLAWRFGFEVKFHAGLPPERACLIDDILHVPVPSDKIPIGAAVYRHELAEAALLWEGAEPYTYPPEPARDARHRVARLVEKGMR